MADLTTLANVNDWLVSNSAGANVAGANARISRLITATSADFMRAINRFDFAPKVDYTEVRTGDGDYRMILRHWPVNSIAGVVLSGTALAASTDRVAAGYYIDAELDPEKRWTLYLAGGESFTDGAPIVVTYNAGYDTAAVPGDVEQAVIDWVVLRFTERMNVGKAEVRTVGGETARYDHVSIPDSTQAVIERYLRVTPSNDRRAEAHALKMARATRTVMMAGGPQ